MLKFKVLFFALLATVSTAWAQQQQQDEESYRREFNYGINFNSNGGLIGGGMIKASQYLRPNWYKFWALEIVEVKHPKEKGNRYFSETGNSFILGKSNYLYALRPHYGREYIFFRKAPESGVQVNGIFAGGPTIGLLVPYLIIYDYSPSIGRPSNQTDYRTEQYDPVKHDSNERIRGNANFLSGLGQTNVNVGLHAKAGLSFEYGRYREDVTGVEVGFLVEAYPKKMILVPRATNASLFSSVYLVLYYGRRK